MNFTLQLAPNQVHVTVTAPSNTSVIVTVIATYGTNNNGADGTNSNVHMGPGVTTITSITATVTVTDAASLTSQATGASLATGVSLYAPAVSTDSSFTAATWTGPAAGTTLGEGETVDYTVVLTAGEGYTFTGFTVPGGVSYSGLGIMTATIIDSGTRLRIVISYTAST